MRGLFRHEGKIYSCTQFLGGRMEGVQRVTPGRGPRKGELSYEVFTEVGFRYIDVGDWIVRVDNNRLRVVKAYDFERDYERV